MHVPFSDKITRKADFYFGQCDRNASAPLTNRWRMRVFSFQIELWRDTTKLWPLATTATWNDQDYEKLHLATWNGHAYEKNSFRQQREQAAYGRGCFFSFTGSWRMRLRKKEAGWAKRSISPLHTLGSSPSSSFTPLRTSSLKYISFHSCIMVPQNPGNPI